MDAIEKRMVSLKIRVCHMAERVSIDEKPEILVIIFIQLFQSQETPCFKLSIHDV